MTREEAIKYLNEFIIFKKISNITEDEAVKCFKLAVDALQQQPSEGEKVIRISKGTLKARTGKYVIYDVEWLKTHFNTTEAKIYGQPKEEPQQKTGHWIWCASSHKCSNCGGYVCFSHKKLLKYCPECGAEMEEKK